MSVDLVGGLSILGIALVFFLRAGEGNLDWLFPISLGAVLAFIGVVLLVRGAMGYGDAVPLVPPIFRGHGVDVAAFIAATVIYVALLRPVGFWFMTPVMVFVASIYLANERNRRAVLTSVLVAASVAIIGWFVLTQVFYVPLPKTRWWPF